MYYGQYRRRDVEFLREQDIVLTSYYTLASDYRRVSVPGLACKYCFYDKLHLLY